MPIPPIPPDVAMAAIVSEFGVIDQIKRWQPARCNAVGPTINRQLFQESVWPQEDKSGNDKTEHHVYL